MKFAIMSFATIDTPYEEEIKNLVNDCKKLKVPIVALTAHSTGQWVENTMLKPQMILQAFRQTKYENLVWVDADARINSYPDFFDKLIQDKIDFSVFEMSSEQRITSGTIFMKKSDAVISFVEEWMRRCLTAVKRLGDQACLRELIKSGGYRRYHLLHQSLPYSYCYIVGDTLRSLCSKIPKLEGSPVILHTQASRRYRKAI